MTNPERSRFGLIWRIYDIVTLKGLNFQVPTLDSSVSILCGWLIGGECKGTNFLVSAVGCEQPAANPLCFLPHLPCPVTCHLL